MPHPIIALLLVTTLAAASTKPAVLNCEVNLPARRTIHIPSPDGRWMLIASPFSLNHPETLTLIDRHTGRQTVIKQYDRSIGVAWSPDGKAFFLNDALGSNVEDAYIYWTGSTSPLNIDDILLRGDAQTQNVINADHSYFQVIRWIGPRTLLAEYCGHTSDTPIVQFDFRYRVELTGSQSAVAHKLSGHVGPANTLDCAR